MKALKYLLRVLVVWQTWIVLAAAAGAPWFTMRQPKPFGLEYALREAVTDACWEASRRLPKQLKGQRVAVCRLVGDDTGFVTCKLRSVLDRRDLYDMPHDGPYRTTLGRLRRQGRLNETAVASFDEAVSAAHASKTPYALFGRVSDFAAAGGRGRITLELAMVDSLNRQPVGGTLTIRAPEDVADKFSDDLTSLTWRVLAWAAFVIVLPVLTAPLIRRALVAKLAANSLAAGYALLAWAVSFVLARMELPGWPLAALLLAGALAAMAANLYAFEQIALAQKLRESEGDDRAPPGVYVSDER
jgi:hypothetical protein